MSEQWEALYIGLALKLAAFSRCKRLSVGAVITSPDYRYVYAVGYNGLASGELGECSGLEGACGCIHAEDNAVTNCTVSRYTPKRVFLTHSPCVVCARRFVNLGGVQSIRYLHEYRDSERSRVILARTIPEGLRPFKGEPT